MDKEIIVPTNDWLIHIKQLITKNVTTTGLLIISKLIDDERVIVKITKMKSKFLPIVTKLVNKEPNFIKTFLTFSCYEKEYYLNNKYKDANSFCNGDKNNQKITLEITKRYSVNFSDLIGKLSIEQTKNILAQLFNAQLNVFYKYGFVHNDINKGNILFEYVNEKTQHFYIICKSMFGNNRMVINNHVILKSDIIPVICDFDKSQCYNPEILNEFDKKFFQNEQNYNERVNTFYSNLTRTVDLCLLLLQTNNIDDKACKLKKKITDMIQSETYEMCALWNIKIYGKYFAQLTDWIDFRDKTIRLCTTFINSVMHDFDMTDKIIPDKCFISER